MAEVISKRIKFLLLTVIVNVVVGAKRKLSQFPFHPPVLGLHTVLLMEHAAISIDLVGQA
jgi:hypothetical protein